MTFASGKNICKGMDWGTKPWLLQVPKGDWSNARLRPGPSGSDLVYQGEFRASENLANTASEFTGRTFQLHCGLCMVTFLKGKYGLFTFGSTMTLHSQQ